MTVPTGPYETERDTWQHPAYKDIDVLHQGGLIRSGDPERLVSGTLMKYLDKTCARVGVTLGGYERMALNHHAIVGENADTIVTMGLIERAYAAGQAAAARPDPAKCERCDGVKQPSTPTADYSLEPSPAELGDTLTLDPGEWMPLDEIGTQIYVYGGQPVDVAVQCADVEDEIRQLRREVDAARELIGAVRTIAETWRTDPGAYPDGAADPLEQIATVLLGAPGWR